MIPTLTPATIITIALLAGCEQESNEGAMSRYRQKKWTEPCHDESTLVATTSGSPNSTECLNRNHRMHVEPVTRSGEEIGALVFCKCERDGGN